MGLGKSMGQRDIIAGVHFVLFDPAQVKANATYPDPIQLAEGFDIVMVNGEIAFQSGVDTLVRKGRVLKPSE